MAQPKQRINLYRPVLTARPVVAPTSAWFVAGLVVLIVAIAAVMALDLKKRFELNKKIAAQEAEHDRVTGQLAALEDQLKRLTSGTNAQVTAASTELLPLITRRTHWVELFQDISLRVPDGIWLLSMDVETMEIPKGRGHTKIADKKTIVLSGFARSYSNVGQLLAALEQSPMFSSVLLQSAEQDANKASEQVNFEIVGELL
jgi:Tfp pilus assembly protein PilN